MALPTIVRDFRQLPNLDDVFAPESRTGQPRRIQVQSEFFDDPLSVEAAYWLGFIYADGSVCWKPRWALAINLKRDDALHLRRLEAQLGGRTRVATKVARYSVCCKRLCECLARLGVIPGKSAAPVEPPKLCGITKTSFLRGMFDGDGCLHINKRGYLQAAFCGHPALVRWFVAEVGVIGSWRERGNTLYAQWTGEKKARAVVRVLYNTQGPALARKIAIAQRYL